MRTSVYHLQTDGLVERFNKTLKQMLWRVAAEYKRDWDLCSPMSSLVYKRSLRHQLASPALKSFSGCSRGRLGTATHTPLLRDRAHLGNEGAHRHAHEFTPGDRVMVLVPYSTCKFLASWQGANTVTGKIGPVIYSVRQPGKRKVDHTYHINILNKWTGTRDQLTALAVVDPVVVDMEPLSSAVQKTELQHLVGQFRDMFSANPG